MKRVYSLVIILFCFSCTGNKNADPIEYSVILSFDDGELTGDFMQDVATFYSYIDTSGSIIILTSKELPRNAREVKKFSRADKIGPDISGKLIRASIRSNEASETLILSVSVRKKQGDQETVLLNAGDFEIDNSSPNNEHLVNKILNYIATSTYKMQE